MVQTKLDTPGNGLYPPKGVVRQTLIFKTAANFDRTVNPNRIRPLITSCEGVAIQKSIKNELLDEIRTSLKWQIQTFKVFLIVILIISYKKQAFNKCSYDQNGWPFLLDLDK